MNYKELIEAYEIKSPCCNESMSLDYRKSEIQERIGIILEPLLICNKCKASYAPKITLVRTINVMIKMSLKKLNEIL